jgi:hypothetical protein
MVLFTDTNRLPLFAGAGVGSLTLPPNTMLARDLRPCLY